MIPILFNDATSVAEVLQRRIRWTDDHESCRSRVFESK